jgi:hypothetical protein
MLVFSIAEHLSAVEQLEDLNGEVPGGSPKCSG